MVERTYKYTLLLSTETKKILRGHCFKVPL